MGLNIGADLPKSEDYLYDTAGLLEGDKLTAMPKLFCTITDTAKTAKAGTYDITVSEFNEELPHVIITGKGNYTGVSRSRAAWQSPEPDCTAAVSQWSLTLRAGTSIWDKRYGIKEKRQHKNSCLFSLPKLGEAFWIKIKNAPNLEHKAVEKPA